MRRILLPALAVLAFVVSAVCLVEGWQRLHPPGFARMGGRLAAGELYERTFGPGFTFSLVPIDCGWKVCVRGPEDPRDLSAMTTPLRFGPNHRYLEGWQFRNADNTGPNAIGPKNVNAPQEHREFWFHAPGATFASPSEGVRLAESFGHGTLEILDYSLDHLAPGERACFKELAFDVTLEWPPGYRDRTGRPGGRDR